MEGRPASFRYRLAPLLRRDEWERDLLGGELRRAAVLAEQSRLRWQQALSQVNGAEVQMRELHRLDHRIALGLRQLVHAYLAQAHATEASRWADWQRDEAELQQLRTQYDGKRLEVRTLEKHRERQRQEHAVEQSRQSQRGADEFWLLREKHR